MKELSMKLYDQARSQAKGPNELDYRNYQCYLWVWTWLMANQPAKVIEKQLDAIEKTVKRGALSAQHTLELGWKAEALERLLKLAH
jgi:hypothetical protein